MMMKKRNITDSRHDAARHVPQRTCVACRRVKDKHDLIRLVNTPNGIEIDCSGKKTGRGVYLCKAQECFEAGLKGNRLEYTLRSSLTRDNREQLIKHSKQLLRGAN